MNDLNSVLTGEQYRKLEKGIQDAPRDRGPRQPDGGPERRAE
jgi:hypothetical protein